jgi:predicted permease
METLLQDLRYAARALRRAPGFASLAVLTLALGIGVNTTIFSIVDALFLSPLPVHEPDRLVRLFAGNRDETTGAEEFSYSSWSYPDYLDYREQSTRFAELAAVEGVSFRNRSADGVEVLSGQGVSGSYFNVLGVQPLLGRTLNAADDAELKPSFVAVISRSLWQRRFGGRADVLGKTITLDDHAFTIVGVVDTEVLSNGPRRPEFWITIATRASLNPTMNPIDTRRVSFAQVYGRLAPGSTVGEGKAEADVIMKRLTELQPGGDRALIARLVPAGTLAGFTLDVGEHAPARRAGALLMGIATLVLLIACANVANLLLARATQRRQELAIRLSLGAGRGRIVRQLLTESALLALLGVGGGLILAIWGLDVARLVPRIAALDPSIDGRVLLFTIALAAAACLAFGLMPALRASAPGLTNRLHEGSARSGTRRTRLQGALVVGQVAISVVLLVGAGLVVRSLQKLSSVDPGFDVEHLLIANLDLGDGSGELRAAPRERVDALLEQVRAIPGVADASVATSAPLSGMRMTIRIQSYAPDGMPTEKIEANFATVGDEYFRAIGSRVVRGQGFDELAAGETDVVLINEAMAQRYWPGKDPVGAPLGTVGEGSTIVGIVRDMRHLSVGSEPAPMIFHRYPTNAYSFVVLHVRAKGDPRTVIAPLRELLRTVNSSGPAPEVRRMSDLFADSLKQTRLIVTFLGIFSLLALLLAVVGLHSLLHYTVGQRTREIGVRVALGAHAGDVVWMVVGSGISLVIVGLVLGAGGAAATTHLLREVLYETTPTDPLTFVGVVLLLLATALIAAYLPARRAARVDPMVALRAE